MENVTFNTIKPNQTIWYTNPYISSTLQEFKVLTSPYIGVNTQGKYIFEVSYMHSGNKLYKKVYFNVGTLNKMFYSKKDAENYLSEIRGNSLFLEYDSLRLKEYNLIMESKIQKYSQNCQKLEKMIIDIFKVQDFELPSF